MCSVERRFKLVRQPDNFSCVLASIAMAKNVAFDDLWDDETIRCVARNGGVRRIGRWLENAGWSPKGYSVLTLENYAPIPILALQSLLWGRAALVTVPSLNVDGGLHTIFWDGTNVYDPNELRPQCKWYRSICDVAHVTELVLLATGEYVC